MIDQTDQDVPQSLRVLCLGDPHFKINNVREMDEMTTKFLETARNLKPDFIVCLGDILDRHSNIHVIPLKMAIEFLKQISLIADLYIVIGNHDRPNNSNFCTDEHPFTACKFWDRTVVADKPLIIERQGRKFIFVPYVPPGRFAEALLLLDPIEEERSVNGEEKDVQLSTQDEDDEDGVSNSEVCEPGVTAVIPSIPTEVGDSSTPTEVPTDRTPTDQPEQTPTDQTPTEQPDKTPTEQPEQTSLCPTSPSKTERLIKILKDCTCLFAHQEMFAAKMGDGIESKHGDHWPHIYPLCISGHIHHYDDLQSNMIYVGTPMQHESNDTSTKTISVFTFDKSGSFDHERIDLNLVRKYIVYLRPNEVFTYEPPEHVIIILCICGTQAEIDVCKKTNKVKDLQKAGIKVKYKTEICDDSQQFVEGQVAPNGTEKLSYLKQMYLNIQQDEDKDLICEWYVKLFGGVSEV